jgi:hypothetical protein
MARVGATRLSRLGRPSLTTPSVPYLFHLPPPLLLFRSPGHSLFLFASLSPFYLLFSLLPLYLVLLSAPSLFMDILHPPLSQARRRSVDVGGLSLALGSQGLGQGWVGWDESEIDTEEQQHLYVIPLLPSTAVCRLIFACSVLQNFLATCTIIRTLSSMPTSDRMSIGFLVYSFSHTLSEERLLMFRWSVVPSLSGR